MSRKYSRKTLRASWSAEDLEEAMKKVQNKEMGVNEASRTFDIPSRTLRRHLLSGRPKGPLGRNPVFSVEHEKKLVAHIKKLEKVGFAPERKDVKKMAFQLAKKMGVKNPFSEDTEAAGNVWFAGFMSRNLELSQRKSEGLSLARAYGMNREDVKEFFDLLAKIYQEHDFANHPEDIYNMDETGIQVNNKPGRVIATKGAKDVYTLTSNEKGENITVIACCNAQGNFLPPVLIYKGTYSKPQFSEGLPPGSQVFMNKKSSYINSDLFMKWFEEVFLVHKSPRKTLLILDGHSSHSNNIRMLEVAKENNVILLCLPSHTTHALQPLDRAFFSPLKVYFAQESKAWMVRNKEKRLSRMDVAKLIGAAWGKAATIPNGISALKTCGIYPYNPNSIPDHYFALSDSLREQNLIQNAPIDEDETSTESLSLLHDPLLETAIGQLSPSQINKDLDKEIFNQELSEDVGITATIPSSPIDQLAENCTVTTVTIHSPPKPLVPGFDSYKNTSLFQTENLSNTILPSSLDLITPYANTPQKCPTKSLNSPNRPYLRKNNLIEDPIQQISEKTNNLTDSQETPTKILSEIHPVPKIPPVMSKRKQKAVVLTSDDHMEKQKLLADKKKRREEVKKLKQSKQGIKSGCISKTKTTKEKNESPKKRPRKVLVKQKNKKKVRYSSSSESNDENLGKMDDSEEEISDEDTNKCAECTENYYQTKSSEDWIQCTSCLGWLHEFCTMYSPLCNRCGRNAKRADINNKLFQ